MVTGPSDGVKPHFEAELRAQMLAQGLDANGFGGVVAGIDHVDAALLRFEVGVVSAFTRHKRVHARGGRPVDRGAAAARQHAHSAKRGGSRGNHQRLDAEHTPDALYQLVSR